MPESPRYMLNNGNMEGAVKYFQRSARLNKLPVPKHLEVYLDHSVSTISFQFFPFSFFYD